MEEDPLRLDTRRRIYDLIRESPGIHFREVARRLDLPMGAVEYHLNYLKKKDMIAARMEGRYKRYYAEGKLGSRDRTVLPFLRQKIPRAIIMHLMLHPGVRHKDLRAILDISGSTLTFHMKKMIVKGVLEERKEGGPKRYFVVDPDAVSRSLLQFKRSFMDDLVDSFTETWLEMNF